jgi:hypothetical protein
MRENRFSTFSQFFDHSNPDLGTFEQFYYYNTTFWQGPGSPVILYTPGESNVTVDDTIHFNFSSTTGILAEEIGAAIIILEHRYWGRSSPFPDLATKNLQYLTLENSIKDLTNFARNADLPFARLNSSNNADNAPWILVGGSYSGALAAWTASVAPGTFWAYYASSAPVQAIPDYWGYFLPIQQGMPKNCSEDVSAMIDHMDDTLLNGTKSEIIDLKSRFGLAAVQHNDDFMTVLQQFGPDLWQDTQFAGDYGFFAWCDYIEGSIDNTASSTTGPDKALDGYARWLQDATFPNPCKDYAYNDYLDGTNNTNCFETHNASSLIFLDTTLSNTANRQWVWMLCNEPFEWWPDGAPKPHPSISSRLVTAEYWARQCALYFPPGPNNETYGLAKGKTAHDVNTYTGGWNMTNNTTRLLYVNGEFDPWREASMSSDFRPGGPLNWTAQMPVFVVPGGSHCSDLYTENGVVNEGAKHVIDAVIRQLKVWVEEWPGDKNGSEAEE